jgi:hypothetical protein
MDFLDNFCFKSIQIESLVQTAQHTTRHFYVGSITNHHLTIFASFQFDN